MSTIAGMPGPIFVGGPERSGKTYMRMMLAAHPRIAMSRRTNMWTYYYGRFGNLDQPANQERCLQAMMQRKLIRALEPDLDRIRREFSQGPKTYGRLFALIHEQYATRQGKERWGDQTGLIERAAVPVFAAYPNARLIQMIRDPRDQFEALFNRIPRERGRLGQAMATWLYSEALARRNERAFAGRVKVVRYESMVSRPEETMRDVCQFLGEEFTPAMLAMSNEARFHQPGQASATPNASPLKTTYIGRYQGELTRQEVAFVQAQTGARMADYGYTLAPINLTGRAMARFYLSTWAPNLVQMAGWRALHLVRVHLATRTTDERRLAPPTTVGMASQSPG